MKIQSLLTIFLVSTLCSPLFSQDAEITWGKEFKGTRGNIFPAGQNGDSIIAIQGAGKEVNLFTFAANSLDFGCERRIIGSKSSKTPATIISKDYSFEQMLFMKNKAFICCSKYDKKADLNSLFLEELTSENVPSGEMKLLDEISAKSKSNPGTFGMFQSRDLTKLLVVSNPPYEKYVGEKFSFKIYDQELKELNHVTVELPYKDKDFETTDYLLGADGMIYLLAKIEMQKKDKKDKNISYYYEILTIDPKGEGLVTEYEMKLSGKKIVDVAFALDDHEKITCAGFYSESASKVDDVDGIYFMRLNPVSKDIEATGVKPLSKEFIAELVGERAAKKGHGISSSYSINEIINKSDGGTVIVAEDRYDYWESYTTMVNNRMETHWYHVFVAGNIVAIKVTLEGNIQWYSRIPKKQSVRIYGGRTNTPYWHRRSQPLTQESGGFISYILMQKGEKLYFIYNENRKNMDPNIKQKTDKPSEMYDPKNSVAVSVEMASTGEFTKKTLFDSKKEKMMLMTGSALKINDHENVAMAIEPPASCCSMFNTTFKNRMVRIGL